MSKEQDWSQTEKFFARSWTHIFYFWKLRQIMLAKTVKILLQKCEDHHVIKIVDLGCGPGTNIFDVYDVCADFKQVQWFGLDLNQREAAMGASRSQYRAEVRKVDNIHFMSGDIFKLPFADHSIDILISSEVVEHLPNPLPALQEMQRVLKPKGYAMVTTPNPRNLPEMFGYFLDKISLGAFKKFYWKGQDEVSAPALDAEVGFGHVSVHPFPVWRDWFEGIGMPVVKKVRGPMIFGSPFFDRHRFLIGLLVMLDPILDRLPFRFLTTTNLGMLCQKK
ncbi:MAG: class I SAM-dependent methyltransferase [Zetaproteobacteria bacterium]|nr:class I SAM-dependent methyltransferase [Zetaproteobacteria bacterium]